MNPTPIPRPGSRRESRLAGLLASMLPPYRRWLERCRNLQRRALRKTLGPMPPYPVLQVGKKEADIRLEKLAVLDQPPTCIDVAELRLGKQPKTRCVRTGLVLARGRCPDCTCHQ